MSQISKNNTELFQVAVLFEEKEISDLVSILISSHGFKTRKIQPGEEIQNNERVVTEPQFITYIPEDKKQNSLLIGNKDTLAQAPGIKLARPLTEDKVLNAIHEFLSFNF